MFIGRIHSETVNVRRSQVLARHIASLLPSSCQVLDLGSGDGYIAHEILKIKSDITISGIDVLVRENALIPVMLFDGRTIPYPDNSFDVVLLIDVLHHTSDLTLLLDEAVRVTRKYIIIKDHYQEGILARQVLSFMDWVGNARHGVALPYNYQTKKQWSELYQKTNLKPLETVSKLRLYPGWADWIFGRNLHFVSLFEKNILT